MAKIVVVDDDPAMVTVLSEVLKSSLHEVIPAGNPERAFELVTQESPDLVLADIEMPEGNPSGMELLQKIKDFNNSVPVVMITGQGTKERAVDALRGGAQDFIEKPFQIDSLVRRVESALAERKAVYALQENAALKLQLHEKFRFENIIGSSPAMERVFRIMERVSNTDSTVVILGESGTGKELVAKALHQNSRRASMPFVAVNCSALPEHLLESELFGHRKGAFTGAAFDKLGLFQHADNGTIFLDEIGSMAPGLQSKLLRFLQDKELRRVGDTDTIKVNVRVLAATNEPLQEKMKQKTFREDLYYRISVIALSLPPLRDRVEDIPVLTAHFLNSIAKRQGTTTPNISEEVIRALTNYPWPGNVRELQNALERACALCDDGVIELRDLPERVLHTLAKRVGTRFSDPITTDDTNYSDTELGDRAAGAEQWAKSGSPLSLKDFLHAQEVAYIEQAIHAAQGSKEKAAEMLGISMATLYRKLAPGSLHVEHAIATV